jgi:glutathione peroxidase-family protein
MKFLIPIVIVFSFLNAGCSKKEKQTQMPNKRDAAIYSFKVNDIDGKEKSLVDYKGKVLLIVNVASKCGFTPQYTGLQNLYEKYSDQGFVVLGFPANNFGQQEPGSNAEIKEFCSTNFHITFPMFSKISVKGEDIHPLYKYLTESDTNPNFAGEITWNFNKFLVDKNGNVIQRFDSSDKPESYKMVQAIEQLL